MKRGDDIQKCSVRIVFGRDEWSTLSQLNDLAQIDVGDYSDERLAALQAEVARKIERAWQYMRERNAEPV